MNSIQLDYSHLPPPFSSLYYLRLVG
jgi:hypothetical protein